MITPVLSKWIVDTAKTATSAAGIAGIYGSSNPRATAVATIAASIAGMCFDTIIRHIDIPKNSINGFPAVCIIVFALGGSCWTRIYFGSKAGKQIDPEFNYTQMCINYYSAIFIVSSIGKLLGVDNWDFLFQS